MKNKKMENLTEEQKIEKLVDILEEGGDKKEVKEEEKKDNKQEKKEEKKEDNQEKKEGEGNDKPKEGEEEKKKPSPIAKVKTMKKKAKRTKRDDIYDDLKSFLEEKYGEVRMSKEGWAFQVEEGGEQKWHCVRVIAKKVQPEFK